MNFNCFQIFCIVLAGIGFIPWTTQSQSKSSKLFIDTYQQTVFRISDFVNTIFFFLENSQLFLNIYKIPEITPQPINVATNQVKKLILPPLTLIGGVNDKVRVINTGKSGDYTISTPILHK